MSFNMRWLGTAGFELIMPGEKHLLIDPHLDNSVSSPIGSSQIKACDLLFLTHGHWDHVLDVGTLAKRFTPPIYCNQSTAEALVKHQNVDPSLITTLTAGDSLHLSGLKVEVLAGMHVNLAKEHKRLTGKDLPAPEDYPDALQRAKAIALETAGTDQIKPELVDWRSMYPGGEQLNFVFQLTDGQRVYMAGSYPDPKIIEEAKKAKADITLIQCMSSNKLKGLEQQTARMIFASGCKTAIPQHHDPLFLGGRQTNLSKLREIVERAGIEFLEMEPGRWYAFSDGKASTAS